MSRSDEVRALQQQPGDGGCSIVLCQREARQVERDPAFASLLGDLVTAINAAWDTHKAEHRRVVAGCAFCRELGASHA